MGGKGSKGAREYRGKEEGMGPLPSRASRARFSHFPLLLTPATQAAIGSASPLLKPFVTPGG